MSKADRLAVLRLFALCYSLLAVVGCSNDIAPTPLRQPAEPNRSNVAVEPQSTPVTKTSSVEKTELVGTTACIGCHPKQYVSYLSTSHSRSLARVANGQPDLLGTLSHTKSNSTFDVLLSQEQQVHRQWKHFPMFADARLKVTELPVSYVMGSGSFAKGYLLSDPPYLLQSPVTWYRTTAAFGMAPGYDHKVHSGMTRVITDDCLFCHAGSISFQSNNDEQYEIQEVAIGCERCHGSGQRHVAKFSDPVASTESAQNSLQDTSIIHPGKLSRELAEDLCAQCHLQGDIVVQAKDKSIWDFNPGQRLSDTRVTYKIDSPKGEVKIFVDHFDQLWQSKCYSHSDSLTCITCHDPHHVSSPASDAAYQQSKCLSCHDHDSCGVDENERLRQNNNQCVSCHMPKAASEVPHAATTNHQIGVHLRTTRSPQRPLEVSLRQLHSPLAEESDSISKRIELLATAYWILDNVKQDEIPNSAVENSIQELLQFVKTNPNDARVLSTLARLARRQAESSIASGESQQVIADHWQIAANYAEQTLRIELHPTSLRKAALEVLAAKQFNDGEFYSATKSFLELTTIRRSAVDWYNLGLCYGRLKQFSHAEAAFYEAIRLDGTYAAPYRSLAILYASVNPPLAEQMRRTHELLIH